MKLYLFAAVLGMMACAVGAGADGATSDNAPQVNAIAAAR